MKSSLLMAFAGALGLLLVLIPTVSAHSELGQCTPAPNAVLTEAPTNVRCKFSGSLVVAQSILAVFDANNIQVDKKDTGPDPADEDDLTLVVNLDTTKLSKGTYKVQWVSVSEADGHRAEGQWSFSIGAGTVLPANASPPPTVTPTETAPGTATTTPPLADTATSVDTPMTIPVLPPPGPTSKDLPAGKGGVLIRNYYGQQLTFTMNGAEYAVPANDTLLVILAPDTYTYSANVFGDDDTEVMDAVDVKVSEIAERGFYLIRRTQTQPGEEEPEDEGP